MSKRRTPKELITTNAHELVRQAPSEVAAIDPFKMSQKEIEACTVKANVVAEFRKVAVSEGHGEILRKKKKWLRDYNQGEFGPYPQLHIPRCSAGFQSTKLPKTLWPWPIIAGSTGGA